MTAPLLKDLSYYRTGGSCRRIYAPTSITELAANLREIATLGLPFFYLGAGSNSLVMDEYFDGCVISFHALRKIRRDGNSICAEAGISNTEFAEFALSQGLTGAAWMNRLPGQLGATIRMNARCYGGEISEIVTEVTAISPDGRERSYRDPNMFRGYKDTIFMTNGEAICSAKFELKPGDPAGIKALMEHCASDREKKNQFVHPSCGCVFKNNYAIGVPSGMLLEHAGAKDLLSPHVQVNPKHANFVFNTGGASSTEILEHTLKMRELVYQHFGVHLEYEMEILGQIPEPYRTALTESRTSHPNEALLDPLRKSFHEGRRGD